MRTMINAITNNDEKAFRSFFSVYHPKIKYFIAGFLNSNEEAEDLTQDTLVKIWQNRHNLGCISNLESYLYCIAKNILFDYIKKNKKMETSNSYDLQYIKDNGVLEEYLQAKELKSIIDYAIEKMPPQRKMIFKMSRLDGISNTEIADKLSISKRTVETHISVALSNIRNVISSYE